MSAVKVIRNSGYCIIVSCCCQEHPLTVEQGDGITNMLSTPKGLGEKESLLIINLSKDRKIIRFLSLIKTCSPEEGQQKPYMKC